MGRRLARGSEWLCLGLLVRACAILQAQDFQQGVDHLSQTEVLARWGVPQAVVAGAEGETLWICTARAHIWKQPGGLVVTHPGWVVPGGERCTQYLLRFDRMQDVTRLDRPRVLNRPGPDTGESREDGEAT